MNRAEFIGLTNSGNEVSLDYIVNSFDHTMAAYDILKNIDLTCIHSTIDYNSSLRMKVESPEASKLYDVVSYVNKTMHNYTNSYGRIFSIEAINNEENSIELIVRENINR